MGSHDSSCTVQVQLGLLGCCLKVGTAFSLHSLVSPCAVWLQPQSKGLMRATSLHHKLFLALVKATSPHLHPITAHRLTLIPIHHDRFPEL